ncbi:MAG: hypothetical protein NC453_23595 [Muribaculum sp.]|nr:hypothetical protein [Muribaculum sp.]
MNESNTINNSSNDNGDYVLSEITPEIAADIKTIAELWSLAKMRQDTRGDKIWEALFQMGCNPEPFDKLGYSFDYKNFNGIYIPLQKTSGVARFAFPKLTSVGTKSREELMESVNVANSLVSESKFTIMGDEVWLIYERDLSVNKNYMPVIEHILENLKSGAEIFHEIS